MHTSCGARTNFHASVCFILPSNLTIRTLGRPYSQETAHSGWSDVVESTIKMPLIESRCSLVHLFIGNMWCNVKVLVVNSNNFEVFGELIMVWGNKASTKHVYLWLAWNSNSLWLVTLSDIHLVYF